MGFKKHRKVVFGSYVEAHEEPNITKKKNPRTHECITLGPTVNIKGMQNVF